MLLDLLSQQRTLTPAEVRLRLRTLAELCCWERLLKSTAGQRNLGPAEPWFRGLALLGLERYAEAEGTLKGVTPLWDEDHPYLRARWARLRLEGTQPRPSLDSYDPAAAFSLAGEEQR